VQCSIVNFFAAVNLQPFFDLQGKYWEADEKKQLKLMALDPNTYRLNWVDDISKFDSAPFMKRLGLVKARSMKFGMIYIY